MRTGIKPDEDLIAEYQNLKIHNTLRVMILDINKDKLECVFKADSNFNYKDLFAQLPSNEPRFIVYDFDYETNENPPRKTNKLIFIFWCPLTAPATKRFTYSSSIGEIVNTLGAIQKQFQVDDFAGLDYETIRKDLLKI